MNNPFTPGVIHPEAPFCNRRKELKELKSYASSSANVVLYSPRRYGKTSLVKRVQSKLFSKKVITVYVDLFGVTTIDEVAKRTARSIYLVTQKSKPLFKKVTTLLKTFRPVLKPTETGDTFEVSGKTIELSDISDAYEKVIEDERYFFEASTQGLTVRQVSLLKALADDASQPVFSSEFLNKHRLSQGLVQKGLPKLSNLDLIEKNDQNGWELVDPVFREWLQRM